MSAKLDLRELAVDRPQAAASGPKRRKPMLSRYVIPGVILVGFVSLLAWAARDQFLPRKQVTVVPVVIARAEVQQAGTPLFQAAGWIEPRPTPSLVAALADGVVKELLVVDGEFVKAGDPVARLIDIDSLLLLDQAKSVLALRAAEVQSAEAELKAAKSRYEKPLHLQSALAEAESQLAATETELAKIPFLIKSAAAAVKYTQQDLANKRQAADAIPGRLLLKAESDHSAAQAQLSELEQRQPQLQKSAEALRRKQQALAEQLKLLVDEERQYTDAQGKLSAARARHDQAGLAVRQAELDLERMVVKSPIAGRVLSLVAMPGARVIGSSASRERGASTVVTLYDPGSLQVRADVRLEDVPMVVPGQPVRIETASSKEPIDGTVLYPTSAANIQKNTLEVKVAINQPPQTIRPEMLVTATFLAPEQPKPNSDESEQQERLLVPRTLVQKAGEGHSIWIVDASGFARQRTVRLGQAGTETLVEVVEGLAPTDKLITTPREGLAEGDRVEISSDDPSLGIATNA